MKGQYNSVTEFFEKNGIEKFSPECSKGKRFCKTGCNEAQMCLNSCRNELEYLEDEGPLSGIEINFDDCTQKELTAFYQEETLLRKHFCAKTMLVLDQIRFEKKNQ
jgi:hypothetical protein